MAQPISEGLADELYEELQAGRWKEAVSIYERHLTREEKRSGEYRLPYAVALIRLGKTSAGVKILAEDPALASANADLIRKLVVRPLAESGDSARALAVLEVLLHTPTVRDLRLRASMLGRQKKWDEAIADAGRAVEIDPRDGGARAQHLQLLIQAERLEEAGEHASRAKELAYDDPRLALLALLPLIRSGRSDEAAALATEVAESEQIDEALAGAIVRTLLDTGRPEQAIETGERLLREGHEGAVLRSCLAEAHLARPIEERSEKAIEHIRAAVDLDPRDFRMNALLGETLLRKGAYEEAVRYLSVACELRPKSAQTRALYARALKQCRRFPEAAGEFKRLLALQPSSPRWQRYAAGALSQAGQRNEARKVFDTFVAERAAKLPRDFEQGLDGLWDRLDEAKIPQARLDWAWSLRRDQGLSRQEWESE